MFEDETRATTRLYLITPPALDPDKFAKELEEALAGGDVACLQLRLKEKHVVTGMLCAAYPQRWISMSIGCNRMRMKCYRRYWKQQRNTIQDW